MAQYYRRIVNPYMPQGSPTLTTAPTPLDAPGEVGCTFNDPDGATYLRALVDFWFAEYCRHWKLQQYVHGGVLCDQIEKDGEMVRVADAEVAVA